MVSQCIICGSNKIFFNHLCQKCYLDNHPILKQKNAMQIAVCDRCELISIKGQWTNFFLADLGQPALNDRFNTLIIQDWTFYYKPKKIDITTISYESGEFDYVAAITGTVNISASPDPFVPLISISEDFKIDINWGECSECRSRLMGSYSSKIQIRSPRKTDESELEEWSKEIEELSLLFPLSDGKSPLFKIIYQKNGIDALFQSKSPANSIGRLFSRDHGGIVTVTTEFAGFDKSKWKEFPRIPVVLITLPEFIKDDLVLLNNKPVQIIQFKNSKVEYWDFTKKIKEKLIVKSFNEANPRKIEELTQPYQIINFEKKEKIAQIMNTENYETLYINSEDIEGFNEGEIFHGTPYNGKILIKRNFI